MRKPLIIPGPHLSLLILPGIVIQDRDPGILQPPVIGDLGSSALEHFMPADNVQEVVVGSNIPEPRSMLWIVVWPDGEDECSVSGVRSGKPEVRVALWVQDMPACLIRVLAYLVMEV